MTQDRLISVGELAEFLGVSPSTIYDWRARGVAPRSFSVGKYTKFKASDVEDWLAEREHAPAA